MRRRQQAGRLNSLPTRPGPCPQVSRLRGAAAALPALREERDKLQGQADEAAALRSSNAQLAEQVRARARASTPRTPPSTPLLPGPPAPAAPPHWPPPA